MKVITLHQPWASLIAAGYKTIETRRHARFRSLVGERIAIHAGQTYNDDALCLGWIEDIILRLSILDVCCDEHLPYGEIICTARVAAVGYPLSAASSERALCNAKGLFGLFLIDVRRLDPPIPARGHQGIWYYDDNEIAIREIQHALAVEN